MKTKLIALALFSATAASLVLYPVIDAGARHDTPKPAIQDPAGSRLSANRAKVEVVFVLDTTGSMGGMLETAKEKIWSIAASLASAPSAPQVRIGLVAYRDRGDNYVTQVTDLSSDLDNMNAHLMDYQAAGGGDGPESVNEALHDALTKISWSQDPDTYRTIFLVGDAPPHMDYNEVQFPAILEEARQQGILVNAIQCGESSATRKTWQEIASLGQGRFFQVEQSGGALAIATPYDAEIARLSAEMDETRLYYGDAGQKLKQQRKLEAAAKIHSKSSAESQARRAAFNLTPSGRESYLGDKELLDDLSAGRVVLSSIPEAELPAPLQAMAPETRAEIIEKKARQRAKLEQRLKEINGQRAQYIASEVKQQEEAAESSLDHRIFDTVREQAAGIGLEYRKEGLSY